jgi:multiple sugar transport system ATP-binding protein
MATTIIIKNLTKRFGDVAAVNNVSLEIEPGSFLTLLGPSGCGKTTLLRCISGLEDPDEGEIYIGDKLVFSSRTGISMPAGARDLGLMFQNYALWPHMTVYKNITFALEIRKMSKPDMDKRVKEALAYVQMDGYEDRYPREMSGGQQQRIALARILAYRPRVFLMDEPLSNLDARLRMDMRGELKRMHHLCDSRSGGGPNHVLQNRSDETGCHSAAGHSRPCLSFSRQPVRGRFYRQSQGKPFGRHSQWR